MPVFDYVAKKPSGDVVKQQIKAADATAVKDYLEKKGLIVVDVTQQAERRSILHYIPFLKPKVRTKELLVFTKYFSILVKAGIPVLKSLKILEDQTPNPTFKAIVKDVYDKVTGGSSLYLAFEQYPGTFPLNYRNLLRIGEESGALHEVLVRLHSSLQKESKLKGKVVGAMVYPMVITLVAVGVVTFLLVFIIPKFVKIFESHGADLPALTKVVVGASNALVHQWYVVILGVVALFAGFSAIYRTPPGELFFHALMLKPPVVGPLMTKYNIASFCTNLDMLSRGGASMTNALKLAIRSCSNVAIRRQLDTVVPDVEAGRTVAKALESVELVPTLVLQMIAVGEETGSLNEMLETISEFYEDEIDANVATLLSLIEPLFILFLGGVVGTIVISMYLPIFKMAQAVSKH